MGSRQHLTILHPVAPGPQIDDEMLDSLRRLYASAHPFVYRSASVEAFPDTAWLAPSR